MTLAIFARPVANMCVVAGTFFALHGRVDDPGVRGAIAWTAGPVVMEILRFAFTRRKASPILAIEVVAPVEVVVPIVPIVPIVHEDLTARRFRWRTCAMARARHRRTRTPVAA